MTLTEQLGFANLEIGSLKRALIDAQAATRRAERTTSLVQGQHDKLETEAAANRQRFCATIDAKNTTIADLEADNARLRKTITDQEDRYVDLVQRCIGARGTRWADRHGIG